MDYGKLPPAPTINPGAATQPGDEVNLNTLGNDGQQNAAATASGSQAPATFSGTPGGYSSTLSSWNTSLSGTQRNLQSNPLGDVYSRISRGQRLSNPDTNGLA